MITQKSYHWVGGVAQVVEHLPTKQTPVPPKKQKNKKTPKKPQEE
jgi:hypothetical protein